MRGIVENVQRRLIQVVLIVAATSLRVTHLNAAEEENQPVPVTEPPALKRVLDRWTARQARVTSYHFIWTERYLGKSNTETINPASRATELWGEGADRFRWDRTFAYPGAPADLSACDSIRRVISDRVETRLNDFHNPKNPKALRFGSVYNEKGVESGEVFALPILGFGITVLATFRPFYQRNAGGGTPWRLVTENAIIDKDHFIKIDRQAGLTSRNEPIHETCWVDPRRDDVIVRHEWKFGRATRTISIDYKPDKKVGWVPSHWVGKIDVGGSEMYTFEESVVRYTVNEPTPPRTLDFVFPPGSVVTDKIRNEHCVVGPGGSKQILSAAEFVKVQRGKIGYSDLIDANKSPAKK